MYIVINKSDDTIVGSFAEQQPGIPPNTDIIEVDRTSVEIIVGRKWNRQTNEMRQRPQSEIDTEAATKAEVDELNEAIGFIKRDTILRQLLKRKPEEIEHWIKQNTNGSNQEKMLLVRLAWICSWMLRKEL